MLGLIRTLTVYFVCFSNFYYGPSIYLYLKLMKQSYSYIDCLSITDGRQ